VLQRSTSVVRIIVIASLPWLAYPQQPLDPPLKTWPAPPYWSPASSGLAAERVAGGPANGAPAAHNGSGSSDSSAAAGQQLLLIAMTPCRVLDTRTDQGQTGPFGPPRLKPYVSRTVPISSHSRCIVPAVAAAYSLNFTVIPLTRLDFLSAWPSGMPYPGVSTLNAVLGGIVSNAAIVPAGANGAIDLLASQDTEMIIDVNGYYMPTASNARMTAGVVNANGSVQILPAGASVSRQGAGQYLITFPSGTFALPASPVPIASPIGAAVTLKSASIVRLPDGSATLMLSWSSDVLFSFVVAQN